MAGLKIKHYAKSGAIRSVGDAPNGILGISNYDADECRFVVHPKVEVKAAPSGMMSVQRLTQDPVEGGGVYLTAEEVVEASVHCTRTVAMLYRAVLGNCEAMVRDALGSFDIERVQSAAQLAREVRDQMAVNGFIGKGS
jgi:hypothetical protein